ncbi:MAG TPA: hypothetical protein VFH87_02150, partial [Candidatus Udaeobacter sp.]|nr:hypothetical protein [Candidatus Udaeobacter sp.]
VLAQIYAWTGESDEAFRLLDHLLVVPNGITVPALKLDPIWDPLRKDPRFQGLIDKYAANPDVALRKPIKRSMDCAYG